MRQKSGVTALEALNARITECNRCPRLRTYCAEIARVKRRAYIDWEYWGKPVPSFGGERARVLVLGLAPGAHGSNRTGRPFTGDGSGEFLYPVLYDAGFASQPNAVSREDGMRLTGMWISAVVRCAPPDNRPSLDELRSCSAFLDEEMRLLTELRVVVCLGRIAFDGLLGWARRAGHLSGRGRMVFGHGAEYKLGNGLTAIASYHPSLQNTNTGRLTRAMFFDIFKRAKMAAGME